MGKTNRRHSYHECSEQHCECCAANKLHQTDKELSRMLDLVAYYNEYKNKLNGVNDEQQQK